MDQTGGGTLLEVPVDKLRIGMFVSELDRPWLDTPFLLQGFFVRNERDIKELSRYCEHVYVDFTRPPPNDEGTQFVLKRRGLFARLRDWLARLFGRKEAPIKSGYEDTTTFEEELPAAREAVDKASESITAVLRSVGEGQPLDYPRVEEAVTTLVDSLVRNRDAVAALVRIRDTDEYTYHHSLATSVWAVLLGRHMGLDEESLKELGIGGALLDLGKTRIDRELLTKPKSLNDDEWKVMREHVDYGLELIAMADDVSEKIIEMVATHHERFDGTGYPKHLTGPAIPVFGRIAAVADSYDAMISKRPWAPAMSSYAAMRELQNLTQTRFQPEIVEQFMQAIGSFPPGTLVELNTGEVAIVVSENRARRLKPKVMLILDAHKQPRDKAMIVDLYDPDSDDTQLGGGIYIANGLEAGAYGVDPKEYFL